MLAAWVCCRNLTSGGWREVCRGRVGPRDWCVFVGWVRCELDSLTYWSNHCMKASIQTLDQENFKTSLN